MFETDLEDVEELEPSTKHILSDSSVLVPIPSQFEPRISKAMLMAEINEYNERLDAEEEDRAYGRSNYQSTFTCFACCVSSVCMLCAFYIIAKTP